MAHIVDGGRRISLGRPAPKLSAKALARGYVNKRVLVSMKIPGAKKTVGVEHAGKNARRLLDDLVVIQEHYGCSRSEALRLGLHLLARAIKLNKALPEVA